MASGEYSGVTDGNQLSFEQQEAEQITIENESRVQEHLEYLRNELPKTSPIPIPDTAIIKEEHKKNGYDQVKYEWTDGEYKYLSRWHTHTPGAPEYSQNTWVVERRIPGIGYGVNRREPVEEVMIGHNQWISKTEWKRAIAARKNGTATIEQKEMLDNGHWKA